MSHKKQESSGFENFAEMISLDSIGGNVSLLGSGLSSLIGFEGIKNIGGDLDFTSNPSLINFTGLDNLTSIGGGLFIGINNELSNFIGLYKLNSIEGDFALFDNDKLGEISNLDSLVSIGGFLQIEENQILTSIDGLKNIESGTIADLIIANNNLLSICDVQSICDYLASPNGTVEISDNSPGCNTPEEVQAACLVGIDEITPEQISIYPNPATNELFITLENAQTISEITIYNQLGQNVLNDKQVTGAVSISTLQPGIYIVEVMVGDSKLMKKLLIE